MLKKREYLIEKANEVEVNFKKQLASFKKSYFIRKTGTPRAHVKMLQSKTKTKLNWLTLLPSLYIFSFRLFIEWVGTEEYE